MGRVGGDSTGVMNRVVNEVEVVVRGRGDCEDNR
jgi:hypothetical protein